MDILGRLPRPWGHLLDIACAVSLEDACATRSGLDRASPPPRPRADMRGPCLHTGSGLYVGHAARSRLGGACARRVASGRYDLPEGYRTDSGSILQGFRLHAQTHREIAPGPEGALWGSDALQTHWGLPPQRHRVSGPYAQLRVRDPETGTWYAAERQRIRERRQDKTRLAAQDAQMVRLKRQLGLDASGGDERAEA